MIDEYDGAAARRISLTRALSLFGRRHNIAPLVLVAPVVVFLTFVLLLPIVVMAEMSFYQRGQAGTIIKVMSFANYVTFLKEPVYLKVLGNSALIGAFIHEVEIVKGNVYRPASQAMSRARTVGRGATASTPCSRSTPAQIPVCRSSTSASRR